MALSRKLAIYAVLAGALILVFVLTAGPPPPTPNRPGTWSFGVFGDAPYYAWEDVQYPLVLKSIDQSDLVSVIHVGDLLGWLCSDEMYEKMRTRFNGLHHPVIYTPGDNEWIDCGRQRTAYDPVERLQRLRQIFFARPDRSLGARPIPLTYQRSMVENARWQQNGVMFATVHIVSKADSRLYVPAAEWIRETFAAAGSAAAIVIACQADMRIEAAPDHKHRRTFEPVLRTLEEEATKFGKPVLLVHGDGHDYIVDHPVPSVPNLTRMQVPGSPLVGWVRVTVTPGAVPSFSFHQYVVPRWKYW